MFTAKCERETGNRDRPRSERSNRRPDAVLHVADVQVLSVHRRTGLSHLRRQHATNRLRLRTHGDGYAKISNQRRDDITSPLVSLAIIIAAAQTDRGGVNRLLAKRAKTLALKHRVAVSHFTVREKCLQAIVGGARDDHV